MIDILLIEDEKLVRHAIKTLLNSYPDFHVIGDVASADEAFPIIRQQKPQVVITSIYLSTVSGLHLTKRILKQYSKTKIIILTRAESPIFPLRAFALGAYGYILKDALADELANAIRKVLKNERVLSHKISNALALIKSGVNHGSLFEVLTDREMEVMLMTIRATPIPTIADWLHLSTKTVSTYRTAVFNKLGVVNEVGLLFLALREGLIPKPEPVVQYETSQKLLEVIQKMGQYKEKSPT